MLDDARIRALREALLAFYDAAHRDLPWRARPGKRADPYHVWVSEVMLQQTRVDVVVDYFQRWIEALPDVRALAAADEERVLSLWQGLGYYSRARRLLEGARYVVRDCRGELPRSPEELLRVPGIGPYSAGAIASIAYEVPAPLVDGNVVRVLTRVLALSGDPAKAPLKGRLWDLARALVPERRPGDFNQALMELGATVCTPKNPSCERCPWQKECLAHARGQETAFPELPPAKVQVALDFVVMLAWRSDRVLVARAPREAKWWAGLWTFPQYGVAGPEEARRRAELALRELGLNAEPEAAPVIRHQITRHKITLHPFVVATNAPPPPPPSSRAEAESAEWRWVTGSELAGLAMPSPHQKLRATLLADPSIPAVWPTRAGRREPRRTAPSRLPEARRGRKTFAPLDPPIE